MTNKSVKSQLLRERKAANRGRKMIRQVTKKSVTRNEVYEVWNAYLDLFKEDLVAGKEVKGMANVGSFIIEKKRVPKNVEKLRAKGLMVKNGFFMPIKRLNINNLDYICKVVFRGGKSLQAGVKFYPCKELRSKIEKAVIKGKDYIHVN